jgi:hypothetical protein
LGHASNKVGMLSFVPLKGDVLQAFSADSSMDKCIMDSHVVYRDEAISLEHEEAFILEIVGILMDKLQKIVNVGFMKNSITTVYDLLIDYIACLSPKLQDSEKCTLRKPTAELNII